MFSKLIICSSCPTLIVVLGPLQKCIIVSRGLSSPKKMALKQITQNQRTGYLGEVVIIAVCGVPSEFLLQPSKRTLNFILYTLSGYLTPVGKIYRDVEGPRRWGERTLYCLSILFLPHPPHYNF